MSPNFVYFTTVAFDGLGVACCTFLAGNVIDQAVPEAKDYTPMALLGLVLVVGGGFIAKLVTNQLERMNECQDRNTEAMEKSTAAIAGMTTQLALLTQQTKTSHDQILTAIAALQLELKTIKETP
jgi:uncharacterized protein involved in response to NO